VSDPVPDTARLQLAATLLASSVIGAPLVIGTAVQTVLFSINPRGLDLTRLSAYEVEIGAAFAASFVGAVVAVVIVFRRLAAAAGTRQVLRIPYAVLLAQIVFAVLALVLFGLSPGV